jgi:ATP-dependent phosphofructokinase / diphosphate-dependent phosphofructokinase
MVVEVMGRHAGWIATYAGLAGGAHMILIPEKPFDIEDVCARITRRHERGANFSIVVAAEGATPAEGTMELQSGEVDDFGHVHLGGIGHRLQAEIEQRTGFEARMTQLGHLVRGGTPSAYDRVIATRFGIEAIDAVHERDFGVMTALRGTDVIRVPLEAGVAEPKTVDQRLFDTAAVFFG